MVQDVIMHNRDLDLPTERVMLATFRCDEIMKETIQNIFQSRYDQLRELSRDREIIQDFGKQAKILHQEAMQNYEKLAFRYHKETSEAKAEELSRRMLADLSVIFGEQISKIAHKQNEEFDAALEILIPKQEEKLCPDFFNQIATLREKTLQQFSSSAQENLLADVLPAWSFDGELRTFTQSVENRIKMERDNQLRKLVAIIKNRTKNDGKDQLFELLEAGRPSLWKEVRELKQKMRSKIEKQFHDLVSQIVDRPEAVSDRLNDLLSFLDSLFFDGTKEFASNIHETAMVRFEKRFKYDNKGLPKRWGRTDIVADKYKTDLDFASSIIDLVAIYRIDERFEDATYETEDLPDDLIIITKRQATTIFDRLKTSADAHLKQALVEQERETNMASLYPFIAAFMLFFAWDELWYVFTSPALMFFTSILATVGFALYYTKAYVVLLPIVFSVRDALLEKAKESSGLNSFLNQIRPHIERFFPFLLTPSKEKKD